LAKKTGTAADGGLGDEGTGSAFRGRYPASYLSLFLLSFLTTIKKKRKGEEGKRRKEEKKEEKEERGRRKEKKKKEKENIRKRLYRHSLSQAGSITSATMAHLELGGCRW